MEFERRRVNWDDVLSKITELEVSFARLEAGFESEFGNHHSKGNTVLRINEIGDTLTGIKRLLEVQNGRIRTLEDFKTRVITVGSVVGCLFMFKDVVIPIFTFIMKGGS